jgi:sporulation protein YlmC with PRC-barrel domain
MITMDRLETLRGADVYDAEGDKIGSVEEVFVDEQTQEPE